MSSNSESNPASRRGRDFAFLAVTVFCLMAGLGVQMSVFYNWAVDTLRIQPRELGVLEAFREMPGFLIILVAALTARVSEPRLASFSLLIFAGGMAAYSRVDTFTSLVAFSVLWSIGLHSWMPLGASMALKLADRKNQARRLGQIGSAGSLGMLFGMSLVLIVGRRLPYHSWWIVGAAVIAVGALTILRVSSGGQTERPRFVVKRKYSVYYGLALLEGCRKQVFITFAIYVLVREFHTPLRAIAGLMLVNNCLSFILAPKVGRLIDRIGERKALMTSYTLLVGVFLGYAYFRTAHMLYVMFILDSLLFLTAVGNSTYLKKIADPEDVTPSLATGVTMNHTAAVVVPITGGFLWQKIGYQPVFIGGAAVVVISIFLANRARVSAERHVEAETAERPSVAEY